MIRMLNGKALTVVATVLALAAGWRVEIAIADEGGAVGSDSLKAVISAIQVQLQARDDALLQAIRARGEFEDSLKKVDDELRATRAEQEKCSKVLDEAQSTVRELKIQVAKERVESVKKDQRIVVLEGTVDTRGADASRARRDAEQALADREQESREATRSRNAARELGSQLIARQREADSLRESLKKLESQGFALQGDVAVAKDRIGRLQQEKLDLEAREKGTKKLFIRFGMGICFLVLLLGFGGVMWFIWCDWASRNRAEGNSRYGKNELIFEAALKLDFYRRFSVLAKLGIICGFVIVGALYLIVGWRLYGNETFELRDLISEGFVKIIGLVAAPLVFFVSLFVASETKQLDAIKIAHEVGLDSSE